MPVTAKLSKRFYDVVGEDIANELMDWFNAVDLTYRTDLRELNDLNFTRFDAKLEQPSLICAPSSAPSSSGYARSRHDARG